MHNVDGACDPFRSRLVKQLPRPVHNPQRHAYAPNRHVRILTAPDREWHCLYAFVMSQASQELFGVLGNARVTGHERSGVHRDTEWL
jgi:hypothetical protein